MLAVAVSRVGNERRRVAQLRVAATDFRGSVGVGLNVLENIERTEIEVKSGEWSPVPILK
jgi:hypothetical protein